MGQALSNIAGWVVQALLMGTLLGLYWFYFTPTNPLESIMGATLCMVTAWFIKKILESWFRSRN